MRLDALIFYSLAGILIGTAIGVASFFDHWIRATILLIGAWLAVWYGLHLEAKNGEN